MSQLNSLSLKDKPKARRKAKPTGAKPICLSRRWAIWLGALYGASASALSFYAAHWAIPTASNRWILAADIAALLGGLLLSAPTCYRFFLTLKGNDMVGKVTAAGLVILLEISMSAFSFKVALVAVILVAAVNAISGAQQALKLVK